MEDFIEMLDKTLGQILGQLLAFLIVVAFLLSPIILATISVISFINHDYYNGSVYMYYAVGVDMLLYVIKYFFRNNKEN